jgi:Family of unknown function (DUF5335)
MESRNLEPKEWKIYFDNLSRTLSSALIHLEIIGPECGDQTEIDWQPIIGMALDPKTNSLGIFTNHIDHTIQDPSRILIHENKEGLPTIEITDRDHNKQIVMFRNVSAEVDRI